MGSESGRPDTYYTQSQIQEEIQGEFETAEQTNDAIVYYAIEVGGTCTGEHGVGIGKMKFQQAEHGAALEIMKQTNVRSTGNLKPRKDILKTEQCLALFGFLMYVIKDKVSNLHMSK
ncbi:FAD-linked oxidase C-terminal domain-containing protein [Oceanobacillus saliphilus]|uniref:FAD-linked oxidase C-terminal domain-containing protein n=1 Tax=Oceanobacillus saliphilus TaxID=2925834 RepID=UPI003F6850DB